MKYIAEYRFEHLSDIFTYLRLLNILMALNGICKEGEYGAAIYGGTGVATSDRTGSDRKEGVFLPGCQPLAQQLEALGSPPLLLEASLG